MINIDKYEGKNAIFSFCLVRNTGIGINIRIEGNGVQV